MVTRASTPSISVLLPVRNGARHLGEALDSMLRQDFADFELLAIDDGSEDGSAQILERYRRRDPRVSFLSREGRGLAATLNELIALARGEWVARMDCDDIALPQRLGRQLEWLRHTGAGICGSWARYFGSWDRRTVRHPQSDAGIRSALLFGSPFVHPSVTMRRSLALQLGYRSAWERAEDYDLWERAARSGVAMTNVPEVLLLYRRHPEQLSCGHGELQRDLSARIAARYADFFLPRLGLDPEPFAELVAMRAAAAPRPDLARVERLCRGVLAATGGEARQVVLDHLARLYFRIAASVPEAAQSWGRLHREFGSGSGRGIAVKLRLLQLLRLGPESAAFARLKRLQFYLDGIAGAGWTGKGARN